MEGVCAADFLRRLEQLLGQTIKRVSGDDKMPAEKVGSSGQVKAIVPHGRMLSWRAPPLVWGHISSEWPKLGVSCADEDFGGLDT